MPEDTPRETPLGGRHILVVDDHRINRVLLTRQLEDMGATVEACADAAAVLAMDMAGFDTALLDLQMPGLDGYRLAEELGKKGVMPTLVAVTADATARGNTRWCHSGFAALVVRPIEETELAATLRAVWVSRGHAKAALDAMDAPLRTMLGEDLPVLVSQLDDDATRADALHALAGIAGACRLDGLRDAVARVVNDLDGGMMSVRMELVNIRTLLGSTWNPVTG